ncbi:MAG TPA: hypothetical protein VGL93_35195 [Streptosporangiaceae bacterium]
MYAARGVLSVHTERGTSIVPANRVAWTPAGFTHQHRAHGDTDMRIVFLPPSLARLVPAHPAVFLVSGLAREVLLALTGPRHHDRAARARLHRVLVDDLHEAREQPLHLPEPRDDRLRAIASTTPSSSSPTATTPPASPMPAAGPTPVPSSPPSPRSSARPRAAIEPAAGGAITHDLRRLQFRQYRPR